MSLDKFVTVSTQYGPVKGDRRSTMLGVDYFNFQGIPYMKSASGKLRFRAPVEPESWIDEFDATKDCPSFPIVDMMTQKIVGTEDAGCVNVFTKNVKPSKLYPVLVYIHGGGFQAGSSSPTSSGPDFLLQKDVILVSFNYRVNALGFLSLDDPLLDVPGNAGLKDQLMALKWIKENIKNFGGDPDNVTLFGTSAGGASVHYHLISEKSKGLFHRAILMSGTSLNYSWAHHVRRNYAERIAKLCGFEGDGNDEKSVLEFLESADIVEIVKNADHILTDEEKYSEHVIISMGPVVEPYITEHTFLDKSPILMARDAWSKDIDVIFGGTSNEGLLMYFIPDPQNKGIKVMQEDSRTFTPLLDLNISRDDPRAEKFGTTLKEVYYGANEPSELNKLPYYYYHGDMQFLHGIQRAVLSRINVNGKGKTFTYYLDIITEENRLRKMFKVPDDMPGAEHAACIGYIFSSPMYPPPAIDSPGFKNIVKVSGIITNFAIYGQTGVDEWEANETLALPLKCLHLTKDDMKLIDLPETERLKVWDEIYREAGAVLY